MNHVFPLPMQGVSEAAVVYSDGSSIRSYRENTPQDFAQYLNELQADGYSERKKYQLSDNFYSLLTKGEHVLYVSYIAMQHMIRLYACEKNDGIFAYPSEEPGDGAGTLPVTLGQLETDVKASQANAGMCYVVRAGDGSFIVFDGGYPTEEDADTLYRYLADNTPLGQTPVISAWFITHLHRDHYGALFRFSEKYAESVSVKSFYFHFPPSDFEIKRGENAKEKVLSAMRKWENAVLYDLLFAGSTFCIAGLEFTVLFTYEDLIGMSEAARDCNDTSIVVRMTAGDQRVLFTADIQWAASESILTLIPAEELKADIITFSHHGYDGAHVAFYEVVAAPTVLWALPIVGWQDSAPYRTLPQNCYAYWRAKSNVIAGPLANRYITEEADFVKKIIISGAGTQTLTLPYIPDGVKEQDYEAVFHERTKDIELRPTTRLLNNQ